jgi:hypothetical protein
MSCVDTQIRLECLKLAIGNSPSNLDEAMTRAQKFVDFVGQSSNESTEKRGPGRPPKTRDNP